MVAALALVAAAPALAQTAPTAADRLLLRPTIDGDPRDPPSFRKLQDGKDRKRNARRAASRFNGPPVFGPPPAAGAGTTGFDSLNRKRRKTRIGATPQRATALPSARAGKPGAVALARAPTAPAQAATKAAARAAALPRNAPPAARRTGAYGYASPRADTAATNAIAPPHRRPVEEDPFAAVGILAGGFLIKPAVELSGGYDNNPARSGLHKGSSIYIVAPELQTRSLWSRHELTADIRGSYTAYGQTPSFDRPNLDAKVNGRIDVAHDTRIDLEGRATLSTDSPGSPDLPTSLANLPLNVTRGATAGLARRFNRFTLAAKGMLDRATYGDATLNSGAVVSNKDRNYLQYGGTLRGSYELTPGVKPFVEIGADARVHDLAVDSSGFRRDSKGEYAKLGSSFELTRKLTGEASAGYLRRRYQDPALADLAGFIADASLVWTASALTTVKLTAKSSANESTLAGVSGVLAREAAIALDHAFRRWLIGNVKLSYGLDRYDGIARTDARTQVAVALTYKFSRALWFKGEFRQDWLRSSAPGNDYTASTILLGLRLQR